MKPAYHASESDAYTTARTELLKAEMALRDERERIAALRRTLPEGPIVDDYLFAEASEDGSNRSVKLSELFEDPGKPLLVYQFMYGKAQAKPCPMCSMWIDGWNAMHPHMSKTMNVAMIAAADMGDLRKFGNEQGWHNLRLLSAAGSTFKRDFGSETDDGEQMPVVNIFVKEADGRIRMSYSACAMMGESEFRGLDLMNPVWHMLDLTPGGRGDWMPTLPR